MNSKTKGSPLVNPLILLTAIFPAAGFGIVALLFPTHEISAIASLVHIGSTETNESISPTNTHSKTIVSSSQRNIPSRTWQNTCCNTNQSDSYADITYWNWDNNSSQFHRDRND